MKQAMTKVLALGLIALQVARPAIAEDTMPAGNLDTVVVDTQALNRERARKANEAAARQAAEAVLASNRLDLDIRLIGPTSVKIAGDR